MSFLRSDILNLPELQVRRPLRSSLSKVCPSSFPRCQRSSQCPSLARLFHCGAVYLCDCFSDGRHWNFAPLAGANSRTSPLSVTSVGIAGCVPSLRSGSLGGAGSPAPVGSPACCTTLGSALWCAAGLGPAAALPCGFPASLRCITAMRHLSGSLTESV